MKFDRIITLALLLFIFSCSREFDDKVIRIAEQYGLAYAPLQIMKEKGFLEELRPDVEVRWMKLGNTAAIREAVLSGDLDAGFMGIPPFLIAYDKGMKWKIATGLSRAPLGLVTSDQYHSLNDFTEYDKIALPQPGSIQHILLSMAVEKSYGESTALDKNLISLKHPDGLNALLSGSVSGHFTSPPYLFKEADSKGFKVLITGDEAMGEPFTFIAGAVTTEFYEKNSCLYYDYLKAIKMSVDFINENRDEAVSILSKAYSMDESELRSQLYRDGMAFETDIKGVEKFIRFMSENGYLERTFDVKDILF